MLDLFLSLAYIYGKYFSYSSNVTLKTSSGFVSLAPSIVDRGFLSNNGSTLGIIVPVFLDTLTLVPSSRYFLDTLVGKPLLGSTF